MRIVTLNFDFYARTFGLAICILIGLHVFKHIGNSITTLVLYHITLCNLLAGNADRRYANASAWSVPLSARLTPKRRSHNPGKRGQRRGGTADAP